MRTAIIGTGTIGKVHAEVCRELHIDDVCLCDIDLQKAKAVAAAYFPNAKIYSDYQRMLDEEKPDVVHICTPHYRHAEMIVECLKRDVNVLCEKPLCIREEELERILEAERTSKAQLGVCLQNRYNENYAFVKEYLRAHPPVDGYGVMLWHRDMEYYRSGEWRGRWETEGGGVTINQALHTLDLLQWFMGMPSSCSATIGNLSLRGQVEVEDTAIGLFSGTSHFSFFATNGSQKEYPVEITLMTKDGMIKVSPNRLEINGVVHRTAQQNRIFGKACYGTGHLQLIQAFYACVRKGMPFDVDGQEAAKVMKLVFAMYRSEGRRIDV